MDLLGADSSGEDEKVSFKINENYAKNYEKWRKKEERQKLIDRYGDVDSSDSSSEEEEIRSTPQMDKDWLRAYSVVRFQQPRLYKKGEKFFRDEAKPVIKHKQKATTLKDHEREFLLKKGGVESDDETRPPQAQGKSYFEEQEEIKKSFKDVLEESSDEETAGQTNGLLMRKQKTADEKKKEENEYLEWIRGERAELEDKEAAAELAPLKEYWNDPSLSEKERVLRDYILNNGYIDQEESEEEEGDNESVSKFDAEEEFLEKAEDYELKYNFRHEEPGCEEIKSYPRVIETSVRTKDTKRADKRKRKMDKKRTIKEQRNEDIRLLQRLQQEEKLEKLETLRKIGNNPDLMYDLEADFDPDEHNRIMQKFFNEDYYGEEKDADKKPTFEYDAAVDDEPDDWWQERLKEESQDGGDEAETAEIGGSLNGQMNHPEDENHDDEQYADDPNFNMDADYDPNIDYKTVKKKKKSNKKIVRKLPVFDPTTKTFDEYIDEYLKDKIDTLPFTYRQVLPNDFGLSTEEILKANEKELNAWVSVKRMSAYRSNHDELADKRKFVTRSTNEQKKRTILPSLFEKPNDASSEKKKKKRNVVTAEQLSPTSHELEETGNTTAASGEKLIKPNSNLEKLTVKSKKRKLSDLNNSGTNKPLSVTKKSKNKEVIEKKHDKNSEKPSVKTKKRKLSDINNTNKSVLVTNKSNDTEKIPKKVKKNAHKKLSNVPDNISTDSDQKQLTTDSLGKTDKHRVDNVIGTANSALPTTTPKKTKKLKKQQTVDTEDNHVSTSPKIVTKSPKKQQTEDNHVSMSPKIVTKSPKKQQTVDTEDNHVCMSPKNRKQNMKKQKKKKLSISNFSSKAGFVKDGSQTVDKKQIKRQLMKVMSAARLSKYGIGPNAVKSAGKKKKKKQQVQE